MIALRCCSYAFYLRSHSFYWLVIFIEDGNNFIMANKPVLFVDVQNVFVIYLKE